LQVPGCCGSLDTGRQYNIRYRLCQEHLRSASVTVKGAAMRFCQKCSRFHPLDDFDVRATCRRRERMFSQADGH
jgi:hypothetical protein